MPQQRVTCPRCDAQDGYPRELRAPLGPEQGAVSLRVCRSCGQVFLTNWADEFDHELYDYYAARLNWSRADVYRDINTRRQRELLRWLAKRSRGNRLLDVGCGAGHFVCTAMAEGWDAQGIDLSESAIALCTRFGARARLVDFYDDELSSFKFDVIVMSEFIEHVPHPVALLRRASELLSIGGLLYVTTPNFDSLTRRLVGYSWRAINREHILYFTPNSLADVAQEAGLVVQEVSTRNTSLGAVVANLRGPSRQPRFRHGANGETRAASGDAAKACSTTSVRGFDQRLRKQLAMSRSLGMAKSIANGVLNAAGVGDTIVATFVRDA